MTERGTIEDVEAILDRRIREVLSKSDDAKRKGDTKEMFKLNTVFHWLDAVRTEVAALGNGEIENKAEG